MNMHKGICIESKGDRSIFLTGDGQFMHGRAVKQLEIGEEGYFYIDSLKAKTKWQPIWAPTVAAFAVLLLFLSVLLPSGEAFAYVQVEINPSVELGIDEEYRVISLRDLNTDGESLIGKLGTWKNHSLDEVLSKVIALSVNDSTEEVTITTVDAGKSTDAKKPVDTVVTAAAASAVKSNIEVHLKKATREQWRESIKESVPVGQKVDKFTPIPSKKEQVPAEKPEAPRGNHSNPEGEPEKEKQSKREKEKSVPAEEQIKEKPPGQEKKEVPKELPKKVAPQEPKKKDPPAGQEKKAVPSEPKTKAISPGQEKKAVPKEKEKKVAPPGQEKKQTPGQEKKKNNPAEPAKKEKTSKQQKADKNGVKKANPNSVPAAEKKKSPPQKKNKNGKE